MDKIVFMHMNQLGDLLFSLPVLKAARAQWPGKKLYSLIRPELMDLLEAASLVDEVVIKPRGSVALKYRILKLLRQKKFSGAVLFSESPETLLLSYFSGIPERCGFKSSSLHFLLTKKTERTGVPSLNNNTKLARLAGLNNIPSDYTGILKIPVEYNTKAGSWVEREKIDPSRLIIISPGSSLRRQDKHWEKEKWVQLLGRISAKGFVPVLAGSPKEIAALSAIAGKVSPNARMFSSPGGLLLLAALMKKSKLFIGIDSGAMHLAAALNVPVVALFGPTDPGQIGPMPLNKHTIIKKQNMDEITVEEVWQKTALLLR
jgi:ADP-heptose:LPS heptosyltransferase